MAGKRMLPGFFRLPQDGAALCFAEELRECFAKSCAVGHCSFLLICFPISLIKSPAPSPMANSSR